MNSKGRTSTVRQTDGPGACAGPGDIFRAIGFNIPDEESYNLLAEHAEKAGIRSSVYRADVTLHGRCWKLGDGIEIWTVVYESPSEIYYADCRPAFRSRYTYNIQPWEIAEYCEDGEAIVHARLCHGPEIFFQLQNFTEVKATLFRHQSLHVALAGLASSIKVWRTNRSADSAVESHMFYPLLARPDSEDESYENEYAVLGTIVGWRELLNGVTGERLVWAQVDAGKIRLEVLTSGRFVDGKPKIGSTLSATVWLQGHVLQDNEITARYEGIDTDCTKGDIWALLKRDN